MGNQTKLGLCALFAGALLATVPSAQAISYDLTSDHATGGLGPPPFGTVTLTQNGANVDLTVQLATGYSFVQTGSADFQDFKFNATGVLLGDITVDPHVPYTLSAATGAFNGSTTGNFAFGINGGATQGNGSAGAFNTDIVFHVANATIADLTAPNSDGNVFVADLLAPNGNTGPADATTPNTSVPDGGTTAALLGLGLVGLGFMRRRAGLVA